MSAEAYLEPRLPQDHGGNVAVRIWPFDLLTYRTVWSRIESLAYRIPVLPFNIMEPWSASVSLFLNENEDMPSSQSAPRVHEWKGLRKVICC